MRFGVLQDIGKVLLPMLATYGPAKSIGYRYSVPAYPGTWDWDPARRVVDRVTTGL